MKFRQATRDELSINLTPLIDIVFLLLIFFMVSTTFTRETQLELTLPEAEARPSTIDTSQIEVVVDSQGRYAINGSALRTQSVNDLKSALEKLSVDKTKTSFIIRADADSSHQSVITVMDVAGQLGFEHLTIATQKPTQ